MVSLDEGSIAGWSLSVDGFNLDILANKINGYGLNGSIKVPIIEARNENGYKVPKLVDGSVQEDVASNSTNIDKSSCLKYSAVYYPAAKDLNFMVEHFGKSDLSIPVLFADMTVTSGSKLIIETGDTVMIKVLLNCTVEMKGNLSADDPSKKLTGVGVTFEQLMISNQAPYLGFKAIQPLSKDGCQLGNLNFNFKSISLEDFEPEKNNGQVKRLSANEISLSIGNAIDGDNFEISTSLDVFFSIVPEGQKQQWKSNGFKIGEAHIFGTLPGIEYIDANVAFHHDHETYGNGFAGVGTVKFGFADILVHMECMFGDVKDIEYSYVDVSLETQATASKGFAIYSLIGGYFKI